MRITELIDDFFGRVDRGESVADLMPPADLAAIERLLSDFAWNADRGFGAALAQLFLPDVVLTVNGHQIHGRTLIVEDCTRRFEKRTGKSRHVWSNLRFNLLGDGTGEGTFVQMTFESIGSGPLAKLRVNDVTDRFERGECGAWHFRSREIERQMALVLPTDT